MKLTKQDKELLRSWGYDEEEIMQIERATGKTKTKYNDLEGHEISREQALELLGREEYLSGLARSAFHWSAVRHTEGGKGVYFDSSALFRER